MVPLEKILFLLQDVTAEVSERKVYPARRSVTCPICGKVSRAANEGENHLTTHEVTIICVVYLNRMHPINVYIYLTIFSILSRIDLFVIA